MFHSKNTNASLVILCCVLYFTVIAVELVALSLKSLHFQLFFSMCFPHLSQRVGDDKSFWFYSFMYFFPFLAKPYYCTLIISCQWHCWYFFESKMNFIYPSIIIHWVPFSLKWEILSLTLQGEKLQFCYQRIWYLSILLLFPVNFFII